MPSWSRFGERKSGSSILPITSGSSNKNDEDADAKYRSKPLPLRRRSATQPHGLRRWICLFLLANISAVLFFMFASAWYFPPVISDSALRQALWQGEPGFGRTDLPTTAPAHVTTMQPSVEPKSDAEIGGGGGDTLSDPHALPDVTPAVQPSVNLLEQHLEKPQRGDISDEPVQQQEEPAPVVESVPETVGPVVLSEPVDAIATATPKPVLQEEPISKSTPEQKEAEVPTVKLQQPIPNSIADLIAKMKEQRRHVRSEATETLAPVTEQQPAEKKSALVAHEDTKGDKNDKDEPSDAFKKLLLDKIKRWTPTDEDAIQKNLLVWLKADKGVQVENLSECQATGAGDSCDVKSWTSQVAAPHQNARAEVFTPATKDQARPTFVSNIFIKNELPALFFSCPLTNDNLKLHEYMTLFFVISPAQIEVTSPYKRQKFFGNSPYGQFFFHGGKPGFLSNGGVRELDDKASSGAFHLVTYRLHRNSVEIKMNRQRWSAGAGTGAPGESGGDSFAVRMSDNAALSLGNVKPLCDSNAFQGRIAEVMVYDTILTDARVDQVESYLEGKWWDAPFEAAVVVPATELPQVDDGHAPSEKPEVGAATAAPEDNGDHADEVDDQVEATTQSPPDEASPQTIGNDDGDHAQDTTIIAAAKEEQQPTEQEAPEPISFNPEDVFEWSPPEAVLALKQATNAHDLAAQWKRHVREKIEAIRGFQFGGDVLRAFIRNRKDELIALRQELFG